MKMMNFIFLHRNWEVDRLKFGRRLRRLAYGEAPFNLVIFPEGTTLSQISMEKSQSYAQKMSLEPLRYCLLPRVTGMQFALNQLGKDIGGIFDFTIGYTGTNPNKEAPEDTFGLKSLLVEGRGPPLIHVHVKYYPIEGIPYHDSTSFSDWLNERFREKDRLLTIFHESGAFEGPKSKRFPVAPASSMFWVILATVLSTATFWLGTVRLVAYFYG